MKPRVVRVQSHLEPWRTLRGEFPSGADIASQLRFLLNFAILAPSLYNSQPWRFEVDDSTVRLYAESDRAIPIADPEGRELILSCGAALLLLRIAVRYFGLQYQVTLQPDPTRPALLAALKVTGQEPPTTAEEHLFLSIPRRHTHRGAFFARKIPLGLIRRLREAAAIEGALLQTATDESVLSPVVHIALEAEQHRWRDPRYCREWSEWLRREETAAADGLPAATLGLRKSLVPWLPLVMRTLPAGSAPGQSHDVRALEAPLFACLETPGDTVRDWLLAGQALGRMLLTATCSGLQASYLSHAIQVPEYREQLAKEFKTRHHPQALLRLGYPIAGDTPTPRRTPDEVAHVDGDSRAPVNSES